MTCKFWWFLDEKLNDVLSANNLADPCKFFLIYRQYILKPIVAQMTESWDTPANMFLEDGKDLLMHTL